MIPAKYSRSLYFTPRTPWGRRPQNRPGQSQNYLRASEDQKTGLKQGPVGQEAMDQIQSKADQARNTARNMAANNVTGSLKPTGEIPGSAPGDKAGVPLSLQGQISPLRAQEITDPSRKPLPAPQIPRMTNQAFPLDPKQQLPPPEQVFLPPAGARGAYPAPAQGQPMPYPGGADKALEKTPQPMPFQKYFNGIPLGGGWKLGPDNDSFSKGGAGLMVTPPWWQIPTQDNSQSR